jgi:hypothetical protein
MKKGIKCVVAKQGRVLMANDRVARKFSSKMAAKAFIRNMNRVSKSLRLKDFEMIAI